MSVEANVAAGIKVLARVGPLVQAHIDGIRRALEYLTDVDGGNWTEGDVDYCLERTATPPRPSLRGRR